MANPPPWHQWQRRKASRPNPTLVEVHEWVQPSHCHQDNQTLRHGQLLRWMDIAACLSAERHAKLPCVTVSIDDITFETTVSVGQVVILKAVVNRAFTTSMERIFEGLVPSFEGPDKPQISIVGLSVFSEDPFTGKKQQICKAYSVFVAKPEDGSKAKLPPVSVETEEENREFLLAAERRRMRITYAKDIQRVVKQFKEHSTSDKEHASPVTRRKVATSETQVHTVKIVLPVHANHHGTTFGGQIMEWMTDVATISGIRLCHSPLVLEGIESVYFRGPSFMGERVSLQSSVNKVFSTRRFEVGVRVEGFAVGGEDRHINSAFFTFRPQNDDVILPDLVTDTQVEDERAANAVARHYLWLDRRAIKFEERQVALNSENVYELILKNAAKLMTNFSLAKWEMVQSTPAFDLLKNETSDNLVLRLNGRLEGVGAKEVFEKITNYPARPKWDFMCKHCRSFRCLSVDDDLLHITFHSPRGGGEPEKDFVLLASKRVPQEAARSHQYFVVAYSSVLCSDMPPLRDYQRSQVISSGYIVKDSDDGSGCHITYLHQVGSSVMPFVAKDLLGMSSYVAKVYASVVRYVTEH